MFNGWKITNILDVGQLKQCGARRHTRKGDIMAKSVSVDIGGGWYRMQRMTLPAAVWTGKHPAGTGITLHAVYVGRRSRKVVAEYYSCWDRGDGICQGTYYVLADDNLITQLAEVHHSIAAAIDAVYTPKL